MNRDVDLVSYLPPYLENYEELSAILKAIENEFKCLWEKTDGLLKNEFIESADKYGLTRFEKLLNGVAPTGDTLEMRRATVAAMWNMRQECIDYDMSLWLESIFGNAMVSRGVSASFLYDVCIRYDELSNENILAHKFLDTPNGLAELFAIVKNVLPMNIRFWVTIRLEEIIDREKPEIFVQCESLDKRCLDGKKRLDGKRNLNAGIIEEVLTVDDKNKVKTVVTDYYRKMLCQAAAGSGEFKKITHIAFGSGGINADKSVKKPLAVQTALNAPLKSYTLDLMNSGTSNSDNTTAVYCTEIPATELNGQYISEAALVDSDGNLCVIINMPEMVKIDDVKLDFSFKYKF